MQEIKILSAGLTDRGMVRTENQDQFLIAELTHGMVAHSNSLGFACKSRLAGNSVGYVFFVADGMGGHAAGREASSIAIQHFVNDLLNSGDQSIASSQLPSTEIIAILRGFLVNAHRAIRTKSKMDATKEGMGTTLTLAYVAWPNLYVVHAGDTRCYLMRGSQLQLLTRDHTVANQMLQDGRLDPKLVERSPWSNVLINALGAGADEVFADIQQVTLAIGDTLLLCSDGINKHLSDEEIQIALLSSKTCEAACKDLISQANKKGGTDNITAVAVRIRPEQESSQANRTLCWDDAAPRVAYESFLENLDRETVDHPNETNLEGSEDSKDTADFPTVDPLPTGELPTLDFPNP